MTVPRFRSKTSHGSQLMVLSRLGRSAIVHDSPPSNDVAIWIVCFGHGSLKDYVYDYAQKTQKSIVVDANTNK